MQSRFTHNARGEINQLPCVFAAALRQRCAVCALARSDSGALLCTQPLARAACASLHGTLRDKARFALGLRNDPLSGRTSNSDELKLQCGGLGGLRAQLDSEALSVDVQRLLERLRAGGLQDIAWEPLLRSIGLWRLDR
ncbi:MAG: hypothetical protein KGL40_01790 [Rhodocyclaceae bacterium]|nr:hypothetical protein [Rhodocyclaceae bacterium]